MKKIINGVVFRKEHFNLLENILIDAYFEILNLKIFEVIEYYKLDTKDILEDLIMDGSNEMDINIFNNIYYKQLGIQTSDIFEEYTKIVHNI